MSIRAEYVKCTRCGKKYYWNPDVGKYCCPNCGCIGYTRIIKKGKPQTSLCSKVRQTGWG